MNQEKNIFFAGSFHNKSPEKSIHSNNKSNI